jgi:predicted amino acid dehydrogenase
MKKDIRPIVWIVHPRSFQDIEKGMPILKIVPSFLKSTMLLCLSPYKASNFNENGHMRGLVIAVPLLPIHFQKHKSFSTYRLNQAFRLAKKLGAEKVSVGGMITTLAEKAGLGAKHGLEVFDGTDLLAQIATQKVSQLIKEHGARIKSVGIIGATTKVGSRLTRYLSVESIPELHLFAKTVANIKLLADECRNKSQTKIFDYTDLKSIGECDICILTAFIPESRGDVISNLKPGSIFLSIIEPVSPFVHNIEVLRPDVRLIRGINIKAPTLSYGDLDFVISSGSAFSCLAEALVADNGKKSLGPAEVKEALRANNFQIT